MWTRVCNFLRSLFHPASLSQAESGEIPPARQVEAPHEILKDLHVRRDRLRKTISSYREFGFNDLAREAQVELITLDRRILELRMATRTAH